RSKIANPHTPWCNGNTAPFGGVILGSNPSGVATLSSSILPMKTGNLQNAQQFASKRTKLPFIRQVLVNKLFPGRPKVLLKELFEAQAALLFVELRRFGANYLLDRKK